MSTVNIHDAKTHLSRLVEAIASGEEQEVVIARNGKPVARLVRLADTNASLPRIGAAKGVFVAPADIDADNEAVARLFDGEVG